MSEVIKDLEKINVQIKKCLQRLVILKQCAEGEMAEQEIWDTRKALEVLNKIKEGLIYLVSEEKLVSDEFLGEFCCHYAEVKDDN